MERYLKINCKKYIRSSGNDGNGNGHVGCGFFQKLLVERLVFFFFLIIMFILAYGHRRYQVYGQGQITENDQV
uniref:Uncharacterized protein n=1 Tax=Strongyloides venezuelensis TaxID=75913 RepID=A0A0K0FRT9_STRVS